MSNTEIIYSVLFFKSVSNTRVSVCFVFPFFKRALICFIRPVSETFEIRPSSRFFIFEESPVAI